MSKKLTQDEFINRCVEKHGTIYDYTKANYRGRTLKIDVFCLKHRKSFEQDAGQHMDGQTSCHECVVEKKMESRLRKRREMEGTTTKLCKTCCEVKSKDQFVPNKNGADGLYSVCRPCCSVRSTVMRKCPEYRARIKTISAEYTRRTKDRANARSAARRAVRNNATVDFGDQEYEDLFLKEIYHLAELRNAATGFKWQVDHAVPLNSDYVCGLHHSNNLELITAFENLSKGNRFWPDMW